MKCFRIESFGTSELKTPELTENFASERHEKDHLKGKRTNNTHPKIDFWHRHVEIDKMIA